MQTQGEKPVLLSGIQPTGHLTIGNYLGAIRNWVALQEVYDCYFVLVDLHAITVRQDPVAFRRLSYEFLGLYVAGGVDPERSTMFVQSHVAAHAQLAWILNCYTTMGEAGIMTQFKEKSGRFRRNVNVGLFDYPVLMAADILLHRTALVPVGEDQRQHLELTRTIARRFNNLYGEVFAIPDALIPETGGRVRSLKDPTAKMSKTDEDANAYIALLDGPDVVRRKIRRAVTDTGSEIRCDDDRPGITNLLSIYAGVTGEPVSALENRYEGKGYAELKEDLSEVLIEFLIPIQERYREVMDDMSYLSRVLREGAERARCHARPILDRVHDVLGFIGE